MKRFVTYLYEYDNGVKTRSAGFMRIDIRGTVVNMEVCIRKSPRSGEKGTVYGLVRFGRLQGIFLGDIRVLNGQGDLRLQLPVKHLQNTEISVEDFVGIGIRFSNESYVASCWKDTYAEEIGRGQFSLYEENLVAAEAPVQPTEDKEAEKTTRKEDLENICQEIKAASLNLEMVVPAHAENAYSEEIQVQQLPEREYMYRKIDLTHMQEIPQQDRHYGNNAFLIHGFWNYGYLILKTQVEGDKKTVALGIPGIYEQQEAAMAMAFGFPTFETFPEEMMSTPLLAERRFSREEMEQNQLFKEKGFGCWFAELHVTVPHEL